MTTERMREIIEDMNDTMCFVDTTRVEYEVFLRRDKKIKTIYSDYEKALKEVENSRDVRGRNAKGIRMRATDTVSNCVVIDINIEKEKERDFSNFI